MIVKIRNMLPVNEVNQTNLWQALIRHWLAAIMVAVGVFTLTVIQVFRETPKYKSESFILIANRTAVPVVSSNESSSNDSNELEYDLSTDIKILKSPSLLAKVIKKLPAPYRDVTVQQIEANLFLGQEAQTTNVLIVAYTDPNPQKAKAILEAMVSTYVVYSQESKRSPVTNAIRFIEEKLPAARAELNRSSSALAAFRSKYYTDNPDSEAASEFKTTLEKQTAQAEITLQQTQQQYQELQRQIAATGQNPNYIVTDTILSQDTTYNNLITQLGTIKIQLALEESRYQPNHPIILELGDQQKEIQQLLNNHIRKVIGTNQSLAADKNLAQGGIQQNLTRQLLETQLNLQTQTKQLNELRKQEAQAAANFKQTVQLQQQYRELERQYQLNTQSLDNFLAKLQELKIREAQDLSSWKVLEPPFLPTAPTSPKIKISLLQGAIVGIFLGLGTAYLLEKNDQRIRNLQDVQNLLELPLLGTLPKIGSNPLALRLGKTQSSQLAPFTEAIRSLALDLLFQHSPSKERGKLLTIISSVSGEGKTTVACNLGLALAELGKRVLIVDTALNQPSVHRVFGLSNTDGLSTAITTNVPWEKLIKSVPNLHSESSFNSIKTPFLAHTLTSFEQNHELIQYPDIMTSGPTSAHSISWLASQKLFQLFLQWQQTYDYILIDTIAITEAADARSIIPHVDGVIFVVGLECVIRSMLDRTKEILQGNQEKVLGLVINRFSDPIFHH